MSDDLGFDFSSAIPWFPHHLKHPYVLVRVSDEHAKSWADALGLTVRRCYVSDSVIITRAKELCVDMANIIAARMPDAGSTMAGDFGEILVYLYQSAKELPIVAFGPKKWRLKQDRTKPAPHSDVLHFILPSWPQASDRDELICSEVKTKSTKSKFNPINDAIADGAKDRLSRLVRTLIWLRERALIESLGDVSIAHLERFINVTEHPEAKKRFQAVAVVCNSLVDVELQNAPTSVASDFSVIVVSVPDLKMTYSAVFDAAKKAFAQDLSQKCAPAPAQVVTAK